MGEGADLPDPLVAKPQAEGPSTDDLLAKMAGDEIDRMLADAELSGANVPAVEISPPPASNRIAALSPEPAPTPITPAPPAPAAIAPQSAPDPEIERQLDALFNELSAASDAVPAPTPKEIAPATPSPAPSPEQVEAKSQADAEVEQQLDALFNELTTSTPDTSQPESVVAARIAVAAEAPAGAVADSTPAGMDISDQTGAAEKEVLAASTPEPPPDPSPEPAERIPLLIRLLELLNAPVGLFPPGLRDALGKIGVMTLVNALLLLAYVAFFRRH